MASDGVDVGVGGVGVAPNARVVPVVAVPDSGIGTAALAVTLLLTWLLGWLPVVLGQQLLQFSLKLRLLRQFGLLVGLKRSVGTCGCNLFFELVDPSQFPLDSADRR